MKNTKRKTCHWRDRIFALVERWSPYTNPGCAHWGPHRSALRWGKGGAPQHSRRRPGSYETGTPEPCGGCSDVVELRGVEPLSENNLAGTSPGAVCYLHSLGGTGTNTLTVLVASLCMVRAKLTARTVPTKSHPSPARGPSGADGLLIKQQPERDCRCQLI